MNKRNELLKNSLPLIGAGLGDKLGIHVVVNGDQAWTDGTTICVPNFNVTSKEEKDAVLGFISHEAAHIKFNSFRGISRSQMAGNPLRRSIHNIFEDLRIENAMIDYMIGSRKWLDQIWINRQKEGTRPAVTNDDEPVSILCDYLLFTCRVKFRGQAHLQEEYLDAAEEALLDTFGWKFQSELDALILPKLPKLRSSKAAFNLAQAVTTLLEDFEPEPEPEQEPEPEDSNDDSNQDSSDDSDSSSDSDDSDSNSDSDTDTSEEEDSDGPSAEQTSNGDDSETANGEEANGDGTEQEDSESSDTQSSNSSGSPTSTTDDSEDVSGSNQDKSATDVDMNSDSDSGSDAPQSTPSKQQGPSSEDVNLAIASALTAGEDDVKDDMSDFIEAMQVLASANQASQTVGMPKFKKIDQGDNSYGNALTSRVKQTSNNLTSKLQGLVQEETKVRCRTATSGRNLNSRVLYRAATGDPRLFRTKSSKTVIDTIVEVSIDNSASMDTVDRHSRLTYLQIAKEAQVALTLALSRINGVAITASAFPTSTDRNEVIELLSEGESTKKLAERLYRVDGRGHHTPNGQWSLA